MAVETIEELQGFQPGAAIRVKGGEAGDWVRLADGRWERSGARVPSSTFIGLIREGRVFDATQVAPDPGDVFDARSYVYIVTSVEDDGIHLSRFYNTGARPGIFRDNLVWTLYDVQALRRMPEKPAWYHAAWSMLQRTGLLNQTINTLSAEVASLREGLRHRIGVVQVQVTGTSQVPTEKAIGHVPEAARLDSVVARWTTQLSFQAEGQGCLCGNVTRQWVMEMLGINSDEPSGTFEFATDCGRHDDPF